MFSVPQRGHFPPFVGRLLHPLNALISRERPCAYDPSRPFRDGSVMLPCVLGRFPLEQDSCREQPTAMSICLLLRPERGRPDPALRISILRRREGVVKAKPVQ